MNIQDIHTTNWQMSLERPGSVVTGLDDVRQCIAVILKTRKGEDPLRPHFGCGLFDWLDKPVNTAIPNMKKEIIEALNLFEPRISIVSVTHEIVKGGVKFGITYQLPREESDFFELTTSGEGVDTGTPTSQLILQAVYEDAFRYHIHLSLDSKDALPPPPSTGFASIADLFAWVTNYWYIYGAWHWLFAQNKIVVYVPAEVATMGSLDIVSSDNSLSAIFPGLEEIEYYAVVFKDVNNDRIEPYEDAFFKTKSEALNFVRNNYNQYGNWTVEDNKLILTGIVSLDGFSLNIGAVADITSAFSLEFQTGFQA